MIGVLLELLGQDDFYGQSELIEIAKGKRKLYTKVKDIAKQQKRQREWQKSKGQ